MGPHSSSPRSRVMSACCLPMSVDGGVTCSWMWPVKQDTRVIAPASKPNTVQIQLVSVYGFGFVP